MSAFYSNPAIALGTATNDNAAAGYIGEIVQTLVASGSAVSLTTNTSANLASISLTAGDWDVAGCINYAFGATTNIAAMDGSISSASASLDASGDRYHGWALQAAGLVPGNGFPLSLQLTTARFSLAVTTTIYAVARAQFTVSTAGVWGYIAARRVR